MVKANSKYLGDAVAVRTLVSHWHSVAKQVGQTETRTAERFGALDILKRRCRGWRAEVKYEVWRIPLDGTLAKHQAHRVVVVSRRKRQTQTNFGKTPRLLH